MQTIRRVRRFSKNRSTLLFSSVSNLISALIPCKYHVSYISNFTFKDYTRRDSCCIMGKIQVEDVSMNEGDKSANASTIEDKKSYDDLLVYLNPIAKPLASRKLTKRAYK